VHEYDEEKKTFTMPWGTFMYAKIPFWLKNARAMGITFSNEKDVFIVVYLNYVIVFS